MSGEIRRIIIRILQAPIRLYRLILSPWLGNACRYTPTCSVYALEALEKHGPLRGLWLAVKRLCKCHPYCNSDHNDPVP